MKIQAPWCKLLKTLTSIVMAKSTFFLFCSFLVHVLKYPYKIMKVKDSLACKNKEVFIRHHTVFHEKPRLYCRWQNSQRVVVCKKIP